jgi:hypothetical protein
VTRLLSAEDQSDSGSGPSSSEEICKNDGLRLSLYSALHDRTQAEVQADYLENLRMVGGARPLLPKSGPRR